MYDIYSKKYLINRFGLLKDVTSAVPLIEGNN